MVDRAKLIVGGFARVDQIGPMNLPTHQVLQQIHRIDESSSSFT